MISRSNNIYLIANHKGDPSTIRVQTIAGKTRKRKYTKTKGLKQQSKQEEHKSAPKSK